MSTEHESWRHEFLQANGLRFHAAIEGEGEPVLMLHGFPENWYAWRHQLPAVADAGYRAVAVDLRGYGLTDRPSQVSDYHIDHLCDDVDGLIAALGDKPLHLVSHDWGGAIAWVFASRRPDRLRSLTVMNAPHPKMFYRHLRRNVRQMLRSWYILFFQIPWLPEAVFGSNPDRQVRKLFRDAAFRKEMFDDEVLAAFAEPMRQPGALTAGINYYRALARDPSNLKQAKEFPDLPMPTMVIWAQNDFALGPELCDGLEKHFIGHYEHHPIDNCSHWVQQEQPEKVNELLLAFLAKVENGL